jgi:hypothetical protein
MEKINWNDPVYVTDLEMTWFLEYLLSKGK